MNRFCWLLDDFELLEIELLGRRFNCSSERSTPTLMWLDRVFCSASWEELFQDSLLQSTTAGISDHCPLTLGLRDNARGTRHFHFECYWPDMEGFHDTVSTAWAATVDPLERLAAKFKNLTHALQSWSQWSVGNITAKLHHTLELLHRLGSHKTIAAFVPHGRLAAPPA